MEVCCPKHKVKLDIELKTIQVFSKTIPVAVGHCVKCNQLYVSQALMPDASSITIDKKTYEYLDALHHEYPYFPAQFIPDDSQLPPISTSGNSSKTSPQNNQSKKATVSDVNNPAHTQVKDPKHTKIQETECKPSTQEADIPEVKGSTLQRRTKNFNAKKVEFVSVLPSHCPVDGDTLIAVEQVTYMLLDKAVVSSGSCCPRCRCAYFLDRQAEQPSQPDKMPSVKSKPQKRPSSTKKHKHSLKKHHEKIQMRISPFVEFPKSTILTACLLSDGSTGYVTIVSQANDKTDNDGVWWIGCEFAAIVMTTIDSGSKHFSYEGKIYRIFSFAKKASYTTYSPPPKGFTDPDEPQTVFVLAHKNISRYSNSNFEMVTAKILCANRLAPVNASIYFDKVTKRYFINEEVYCNLRRSSQRKL